MLKLNQRGAIQFIVLLILLGGIGVGVYLVTGGNPLKLFTRATSDKIEWVKPTSPDPENCITEEGKTTCPKVKFRINVPTQVTQ